MDAAVLHQPCFLITTQAALEPLVYKWLASSQLALDTEFMRTQTYYPLPALIQVNDGQASYLLDPVAIQDFSAFARVLAAPHVTKVLHACSEDLEVFQHLFGQLPVNLFDTQIAAAMVGQGFSVGYGRLVEQVLGIKLPKDETRSDWLQRPLTQAQERYAAMDVEYLLILAETLQSQLAALGRQGWVAEDCEQLLSHYHDNQDPAQSHLRLKGSWKLSRREQAVVQQLCHWRECNAQARNIPRNHLLKESAIYDLAGLKPKHVSQLRQLEGFHEKMIRRDGQILIELIASALGTPEEELPDALERPLNTSQSQQVKQLRLWVENLAQQMNIAPEVLARKKDYEFLVRSSTENVPGETPAILNGWRRAVIGDQLLALKL